MVKPIIREPIKIIILSDEQKKLYETRANTIQLRRLRKKRRDYKPHLNCPSCKKRFSVNIAKAQGHEGYCRKACKRYARRDGIRIVEENFTPIEKKVTRNNRRVERNSYKTQSDSFLKSEAWKKLRFEVIAKFGRTCMACGRKAPDVIIHVDHIKPRFTHPHLALDISNLQILCALCNHGKGADHDNDFRPKDPIG